MSTCCTSCSAPCWRSTIRRSLLIAGIATLTLVVLALIYRPLVLECVDPGFLRSVSRAGGPAHLAFLGSSCINLVGGFQALGTLLAVGIMMLPAVTRRFWARDITVMISVAMAMRRCAAMPGLLRLAITPSVPSGPAIILVAGALYARLGARSAPVGGLIVGTLCRAGIWKRDGAQRHA